jgi:hypothetical protein
VAAVLEVGKGTEIHHALGDSPQIWRCQQQPSAGRQTVGHGAHEGKIVKDVLNILTANYDVKGGYPTSSLAEAPHIEDFKGGFGSMADQRSFGRCALVAVVPS